jgi:hypothetical protein
VHTFDALADAYVQDLRHQLLKHPRERLQPAR